MKYIISENYDGKYYGYVHEREYEYRYYGANKSDKYADGITIVWIARKRKNENVIVGWYENARLFQEYKKSLKLY